MGLEAPDTEEDLYHSRGEDVPEVRPLLTGDVLADVEIPGLDDGKGLAAILTHPCSMRRDGVNLVERVFVARVDSGPAVPLTAWDGHYGIMPLPDLGPEGHSAVRFGEAGLVRAEILEAAPRIACLSELGINILQQRFIFHLTRFAVPTFKLHETCEAVFREIELHGEWAEARLASGGNMDEIRGEFHAWIRETDAGGRTRQERLANAQQVASVRREMRAALAAT